MFVCEFSCCHKLKGSGGDKGRGVRPFNMMFILCTHQHGFRIQGEDTPRFASSRDI